MTTSLFLTLSVVFAIGYLMFSYVVYVSKEDVDFYKRQTKDPNHFPSRIQDAERLMKKSLQSARLHKVAANLCLIALVAMVVMKVSL